MPSVMPRGKTATVLYFLLIPHESCIDNYHNIISASSDEEGNHNRNSKFRSTYTLIEKDVLAKEQYFSSLEEKRLLSFFLSQLFTGYLSLLSIYLCLYFTSLSPPLSLTHTSSLSLPALGNIVIIKAKEYL